jgi:hypothetical protein
VLRDEARQVRIGAGADVEYKGCYRDGGRDLDWMEMSGDAHLDSDYGLTLDGSGDYATITEVRARPRGRCAAPRTHCVPDSLTYPVPLSLNRQRDRTLHPRPALLLPSIGSIIWPNL